MRVIILREGPMWVAQCLEHDIAAQGATLPEVAFAFVKTVAAQVAVAVATGEDPRAFLDGFEAAPECYHRWYEMAAELVEPIRVPEQVEIPPAFMVNAMQRSLASSRIYD